MATLRALWALALLGVCIPGHVAAQTSDGRTTSQGRLHRYEAASSGYFRDQDTLPGAFRLYLQAPDRSGVLWSMGPREGAVKRSSFYPDAHTGASPRDPGDRTARRDR